MDIAGNVACDAAHAPSTKDRSMANQALNILIADDNPDDREAFEYALRQASLVCKCHEATSVAGALKACEETAFDCVILDYSFPGEDGMAGLSLLRDRFPHLPIVMTTGYGDELLAVEAMNRGAADYIPKSRITGAALKRIIENAIEKAALRRRIAEQQEELANFSRVLAHDLKAPLSSISGFAALLRRGLSDDDGKGRATLCTRIESAARRMTLLIDTLQAYTRSEVNVAFEPVNMNQVLDDVRVNLDQTIRERRAQVTSQDLPTVVGSAPMLVNLFQNLIANSIKFCEAEIPTVSVAASSQEAQQWLFAVKDNGIGVPEAYYKPIFEPFTRLDRCGKYQGTGLGLATCKKIVERHHGKIWCDSVPGEGTTMLFTLPGATGSRE